jgi:O-acetyl-ADP-ribose deacetylase (regulator of RNase III)
MMDIAFKNGSVLDNTENLIIAHGVNCQGVMGSGVAKSIKLKYPSVYEAYKELLNNPYNFNVGRVSSHYSGGKFKNPLLGTCQLLRVEENTYVANLFTQEYYGRDGKVYASPKAIFYSLMNLSSLINEDITIPDKVSIPRIGAGLGGLDWDTEVLPAIQEVLSYYPLKLTVYTL